MRATEAMIRAAAVTGAAAHAVAVGVGVSGSAHLGTTLPMLLASLVCVGCVLWRTPVMVAGLAVGAMVVLHLWLGPDHGHGQPASRSDPLPTLAGLFMEVGVLAAPHPGRAALHSRGPSSNHPPG